MTEPGGFATLALLIERLIGEVHALRADIAEARKVPTAPSTAAEPEGLWTAAEVASYLRCSDSKIYQAAAAGTIPSLHPGDGGQLRFEPERIRAWARGTATTGRVLPMRRQERTGP